MPRTWRRALGAAHLAPLAAPSCSFYFFPHKTYVWRVICWPAVTDPVTEATARQPPVTGYDDSNSTPTGRLPATVEEADVAVDFVLFEDVPADVACPPVSAALTAADVAAFGVAVATRPPPPSTT